MTPEAQDDDAERGVLVTIRPTKMEPLSGSVAPVLRAHPAVNRLARPSKTQSRPPPIPDRAEKWSF